jgi:hypothetical protein
MLLEGRLRRALDPEKPDSTRQRMNAFRALADEIAALANELAAARPRSDAGG